MKDPRYETIDREAILSHDEKVQALWETYLKRHGVKLSSKKNAQGRLWLAILLIVNERWPDAWIHKDDISILVHRVVPSMGGDQQVRHLKRDGWNLETAKAGVHRMTDPFRPSSEWHNDQQRRIALASNDFEAIKEAESFRCATCGAKEGIPHPKYGSQDPVKLQQGHMDPERAGIKGNIIPQCQFCNRTHRDDFVFDDKGRPVSVASLRPIKRASERVKRMLYDFLKGYFDK